MSWRYLSGLLRSERIHALTNNQFLVLAEAPDADSLLKQLEDTVYGTYFQGRSLKEFSKIFNEYYHAKFQEAKSLAPDITLFDVYSYKNDLNNLKLCFKAKLSNKTVEWENLSEDGNISPERMFTIVDQGLFNELSPLMANALIELENSSLSELRRVDFLLDRAGYESRIRTLEKACAVDNEMYKEILDLYRKETDCENIKNFLRSFTMGLEKQQVTEIIIPGGYIDPNFFIDRANSTLDDATELILTTIYEDMLDNGIAYLLETKSCTILERSIDEYLANQVANFSYISAGPAVVEETLRSLSLELKNLKLIIIGKLNNMSVDEIKGRVRHVS